MIQLIRPKQYIYIFFLLFPFPFHSINEETFWRNYFYRVGLIRQSTELSSLEREGVDAANKTTADGERGRQYMSSGWNEAPFKAEQYS